MSVSKFNFEIRKYIVIDKTNLNKETNFSKSPTNIAINYSARRVIFIQYSILEVGRKLKYRRIYGSVKFYHRGFSNQFEKLVPGGLHKIFPSGHWKTQSSIPYIMVMFNIIVRGKTVKI